LLKVLISYRFFPILIGIKEIEQKKVKIKNKSIDRKTSVGLKN
jgi:hypothetical protein